MNSTVILGDGLLATELINHLDCEQLSRKSDGFDLTEPKNWGSYLLNESQEKVTSKYNTIINCTGHTGTYSNDNKKHWNINYKGVADLVEFCNQHDVPYFVQFITDYIYTGSRENAEEANDVPVHNATWYGYTKLLSDGYVQLRTKNNYLLIRATHKEIPFTYEAAWTDQVGNFDYVTEISKLSAELIKNKKTGVYNVGTPTKTMFDLAKRTKQDVKQILSPPEAPKNVTMSLRKLNEALKERDQEK